MPYLFVVNARYCDGKYLIHNPSDLMSNFPFLEGKIIVGKLVSTHRDGRVIRINKEFRSKIAKVDNTFVAEILDPNPLKAVGLPLPSEVLLVVHRYEETQADRIIEFPVAEGVLLRGTAYSYFEDEMKRILKEQESGMLLEGTIFHPELQKPTEMAKEALVSFEQENFAHTKTSCRRIVEQIRTTVNGWKTVDGSDSLCDKLKAIVNSLFSFASIGGPHEGVTTKEETELIMKNTMSLLFYCNSLLKNDRIALASSASPVAGLK